MTTESRGGKPDDGEKTERQAQMLANRLKKRARHLGKWAKRVGAGAYRLYDRDIPEIPLALDLYRDALTDAPSLCGALYERPYEKDEDEEAAWLDAMLDSAAQALGIERESVHVKLRRRQRGAAQYEKISGRGERAQVMEGGLKFLVNLSDYLDTGLFLDRRKMRAMVAADSQGKRALNLFCYTASFSAHAAFDGAVSTDSVDLSNTYLAWARDNFALNGFDARLIRREERFERGGTPNCAHALIRADAAAFLRDAARAKARWDMIIADPPAFSNSAMAQDDFDLRRDHESLLASCASLLTPGGKLWFSASARSFKGTAGELEAALARSLPGVAVSDISAKTADEDFKGRKTPKAFVIEAPRR